MFDPEFDPYQLLQQSQLQIQQLAQAYNNHSEVIEQLQRLGNHQQEVIQQLVFQNQKLNHIVGRHTAEIKLLRSEPT